MVVGCGLWVVLSVTGLNRFKLVSRLAGKCRGGGTSAICNMNSSYTIVRCPSGRILVAASVLVRNMRFSLACVSVRRLNCGDTVIGVDSVFTVGKAPHRVIMDVTLDGHFGMRSLSRFCENLHVTYSGFNISVMNNSAASSLANLTVDVAYVNRTTGRSVMCHDNTGRASLVYMANSLNTTCVNLRLLRHRGTMCCKRMRSVHGGVTRTGTRNSSRGLTTLGGSLRRVHGFRPSFTNGRCLLRHRLRPRTHNSVVTRLHRTNVHPATVVSVDSNLDDRLVRVYRRDGYNYHICRGGVPVSCRATIRTRRFGVGLAAYTVGNNRSCRLLFAIPVNSRTGVRRVRNIGRVNCVAGRDLNGFLVAHSNRRFRLGTRK